MKVLADSWFSQIQFACFGSTELTIVYLFTVPLADRRQHSRTGRGGGKGGGLQPPPPNFDVL